MAEIEEKERRNSEKKAQTRSEAQAYLEEFNNQFLSTKSANRQKNV